MVKLRCPYLHSFGHTPRPPAPAAVPISRCSVSSVLACVPCLAWSTLLLVLRSRSGCAGVGRGTPAGYMGRAWGGAVDTSRRKNSKKAFFGVRVANTHPTFTKRNLSDCASLQKFRKIQKGPSPGLICAILDRKKGAL